MDSSTLFGGPSLGGLAFASVVAKKHSYVRAQAPIVLLPLVTSPRGKPPPAIEQSTYLVTSTKYLHSMPARKGSWNEIFNCFFGCLETGPTVFALMSICL